MTMTMTMTMKFTVRKGDKLECDNKVTTTRSGTTILFIFKEIYNRIILSVLMLCLFTICADVLAGEVTSKSTGADIDDAYMDCGLFAFHNESDDVLYSRANKFSNPPKTYWTQRSYDMCTVSLNSSLLKPLTTDEENSTEQYVRIKINRRYPLPGYERCQQEGDGDECLEKSVFKYYGFNKDSKGFWILNTIKRGDEPVESISSVVNGQIQTDDGIVVTAEWTHPYHIENQTSKNMITLFVRSSAIDETIGTNIGILPVIF
jgi:hypothetical protein